MLRLVCSRRRWLQATAALFTAGFTARCGDDGVVRRVAFSVYAGGFNRAQSGAMTLTTALGWNVVLTRALLSVGPVYARNSAPSAGTSQVEGRAVAQVLSIFTIDALDPTLQLLPDLGEGVTELARSAEVRFAEATTGPIADRFGVGRAVAWVSGTAEKDGTSIEFDGALALPMDRTRPDYQWVIDHQVQNISANVLAQEQGALVIRIDPRHWFDSVGFADLAPLDQPVRNFDERAGRVALRAGIARTDAFELSWQMEQ